MVLLFKRKNNENAVKALNYHPKINEHVYHYNIRNETV
jgi:hypothetical protein